jgi:hypothetical protein
VQEEVVGRGRKQEESSSSEKGLIPTLIPTNSSYLFLGVRRSPLAIARGWTWRDGRLCARTLFEALEACGIDPHAQHYANWFELTTKQRRVLLARARNQGLTVVALGKQVAEELDSAPWLYYARSLKLRHPAARGLGRIRDNYHTHVRGVLLGDRR